MGMFLPEIEIVLSKPLTQSPPGDDATELRFNLQLVYTLVHYSGIAKLSKGNRCNPLTAAALAQKLAIQSYIGKHRAMRRGFHPNQRQTRKQYDKLEHNCR